MKHKNNFLKKAQNCKVTNKMATVIDCNKQSNNNNNTKSRLSAKDVASADYPSECSQKDQTRNKKNILIIKLERYIH